MYRVSIKRVDEWINDNLETIIDQLRGLVRIPSVSDSASDVKPFGQPCRDALAYMFELGGKYGYTGHSYEDYIGQLVFSEGEGTCGIWTHLDVVPVPDASRWNYPPFDLTVVEDNYMIGRGVNDNKMPAIGSFSALRCLLELGFRPRRGWSLYMGTNEECGMADAKYFAAHYTAPDFSLVPDAGFPVCVGQRGSAVLRLSVPVENAVSAGAVTDNPSVTPVRACVKLADGTEISESGTGTHAVRCPEGENAIIRTLEKAGIAPVLIALCSKPDGSGMGIACDGMAPTALRYAEGRVETDVFMAVPVGANADRMMADAVARASALGAAAEVIRLRKPVSFPEDAPAVRLLTDVYNGITGYSSEPYVMSGGNYAAYIPNAVGFGPGMPGREYPAHIFRPGCGDYHQCDESDTVEHLMQFIRIYAMSIQAVDAGI